MNVLVWAPEYIPIPETWAHAAVVAFILFEYTTEKSLPSTRVALYPANIDNSVSLTTTLGVLGLPSYVGVFAIVIWQLPISKLAIKKNLVISPTKFLLPVQVTDPWPTLTLVP